MPADQRQIEDNAVSATTVLNGAKSAAHAGIVYHSDNPSAASISADGTITAQAPGSKKIVAASEWNDSLCTATRLPSPSPATCRLLRSTMTPGQSFRTARFPFP